MGALVQLGLFTLLVHSQLIDRYTIGAFPEAFRSAGHVTFTATGGRAHVEPSLIIVAGFALGLISLGYVQARAERTRRRREGT